ncbi:AsmA family protein [Kozakia baliensis]|uniref:AsmA family protein n=1 Tax=Kozakia baliensis TaxID=153496 RepID=UPI000495B8F9|nr:hypothetical protein [Kozakia baliensis]
MRWVLSLFGGVIALLIIVCGGVYFYLDHINLASFAAAKIAYSSGRETKIGSLYVKPGRWLTIDLNDLHVANIPDGSQPDMIRLGHLHAQMKLSTLLHGPIQTRDVSLDRFFGLFERTAQRTPNWRFGSSNKPQKSTQPPDQSWFPGLRDAKIRESEVVYRGAKGSTYRIALTKVVFASESDAAPLTMQFSGAYNDTPVTLDARLGPIDQLRQAGQPYSTDMHVASGDLRLDLNGNMTDLLDFDGVEAKLTLHTPTSAPIMAFAGMKDSHVQIPFDLKGDFTHRGSFWQIAHASGAVQNNPIDKARISLTEGEHGGPDRISGDLDFGRLNFNSLLDAKPKDQTAKQNGGTDIPLAVSQNPDPLLNVRISAREVDYNDLVFTNARIAAEQMPGKIAVNQLALTYLGADLLAHGGLFATNGTTRMNASVNVVNANVDRLRRKAGFAPIPIAGNLAIKVVANAANVRTLNEAAKMADITAAVSMRNGEISKEIINMASTDVRLLFRKPKGTTPVSCLLGVLDMRRGVGTVVPLRIRTGEGTISGKADFDLNRKWFDLAFASRASSTGFFSLDVPIRVSGAFGNPRIGLAKWSAQGRALLQDASRIDSLPADLKSFAAGNSCASAH